MILLLQFLNLSQICPHRLRSALIISCLIISFVSCLLCVQLSPLLSPYFNSILIAKIRVLIICHLMWNALHAFSLNHYTKSLFSFLLCFVFLFFSQMEVLHWTLDFMHAKNALYHWALYPCPLSILLLRKVGLTSQIVVGQIWTQAIFSRAPDLNLN